MEDSAAALHTRSVFYPPDIHAMYLVTHSLIWPQRSQPNSLPFLQCLHLGSIFQASSFKDGNHVKGTVFCIFTISVCFFQRKEWTPFIWIIRMKNTQSGFLCICVCVCVATEDGTLTEYVCSTRVTSEWNQFRVSGALFHVTGYWCTRSSMGRTFCSYKSHLLCVSISWSSSRDCCLNCWFLLLASGP